MSTGDLLLVAATLIALLIAGAGLRSLRSGAVPSGYWAIGWAAMIVSGVLSLAARTQPELRGLTPVLSSLFGPLMLAGAFQYVGRRVPPWLLPGAGLLSLACLVAEWTAAPPVEHLVALGFQPALLLATAWVLGAAAPPWLRGSIQCGLVALAAVGIYDGLGDMASPPREDPMLAWLLIGPPVACLQIFSGFERARRRLQETESETRRVSGHYEALLSSMRESPVLLFHASGRFEQVLGAPRHRLARYGLDGSTIPSIDARDVLPRESRARFANALRQVVEDDCTLTIPIDVNFPAGSFAFEVGLSPLRGDDGAIEHVMGVVHDVTQHIETARALREREESLKALLAALAGNRVVMIDGIGVVESVLGATREEKTPYHLERTQVEGAKITDLVPGADGERILAAVQDVFRGGRSRELEEQVKLPGGEFSFTVSLRPLTDEAGSVQKVLAICTDVTHLRHAQKLESIGVLAGGIAHDFNNLLTGILGNAGVALELAPRNGTLRQALLDIEAASINAADLTSQLLDYAGMSVVEAKEIELGAFVEEMSPLLRTAVAGGSELCLRNFGEPVWVRADVAQVRQVVMNLVTNALESLPETGGRVEVETCGLLLTPRSLELPGGVHEEPSGRFACVTVRDTGCGMDAETLGRIFEPFFTNKFQGRGLGLAAAQGIVRSHGGRLDVESAPGEGTTFRVLLPQVEPPVEAAASVEQGSPGVCGPSSSVLVVDDNANVRKLLKQVLESLGFRCVVADGGRAAVALLEAEVEGFDVALIDLDMPDWPGERVCHELRAVRSDLPVAFMTGYGREYAAQRTGEPERSVFLAKPFRRAEVSQALSQLLEAG